MSTRRSARLVAASSPPKLPAIKPPKKSLKRKADEKESTTSDDGTNGIPALTPTTPDKKRRVQKKTGNTVVPPPATPTPSNVKLISEPVETFKTPKRPRSAAINRLADPQATNAQLLSPETSRVVTHTGTASPPPSRLSPSKVPSPPTTGNILEIANAHLISVDARMAPLITKNYCRVFSPEGLAEKIDPFESLCSGIISQQVSGAAAKAIKKRFIELFFPPPPDTNTNAEATTREAEEDDTERKKRNFPTPSQVSSATLETLRTAGLSQRKAEYVSGLASKFVSGELSAQLLADAAYEEVLVKLTAVRGLGKWSVEMFACFALKRMDVFSLGDLGVQRGMAAFVGRDVAKLKNKGGKNKYMSEAEMAEISDRFAPYRSLFMWYMWRVEETDISTME